jgi:hypothetical protein
LAALREICAGKIHPDDTLAKMGAAGHGSGLADPVCIVCESLMREVKGKWACADVSCAKYGVEQKSPTRR